MSIAKRAALGDQVVDVLDQGAVVEQPGQLVGFGANLHLAVSGGVAQSD